MAKPNNKHQTDVQYLLTCAALSFVYVYFSQPSEVRLLFKAAYTRLSGMH